MVTNWTLLHCWRTEFKKSRMKKFARACLITASSVAIAGCAASPDVWSKTVKNNTCEIDRISATVDSPSPEIYPSSYAADPITPGMIRDSNFSAYTDMRLDDVIRLAMQNSTVFRDLGGVVLRSPDSVQTRLNLGMTETDPRFSMEAALSAFDAQFTASATYQDNDRLFNNAFFSGGTSEFVQDLHEYNFGIDKRTATGALMSVRSRTIYDGNNAPANNFPSYYDTLIDAEIRQPLLQGAGLEFNRIAGPGGQPGLYNGFLIAKTNSDISHHEFQIALRDYLSNVENAYWDLYFAYRELDARKKAMEQSLEVWNKKKAGANAGLGNNPEESLARQQYFKFKADFDESISGRLLQGTQTRNGSNGGTMQGSGGVLAAERRLRLLVGLPAADGALIRAVEEPLTAKVIFDWGTISQEALSQRAELRRQQLVTKKHKMELLAARNFLNPRLDAVARYRIRGLGDDFIKNGNNQGSFPNSSIGNLLTGEHQEYMLGFEFSVPLGYRQGHAAVSNAEFALARSRAIFKEQQREVINDLNASVVDASRAHQAIEDNLNQYLAAQDYLKARKARALLDNEAVDLILDAQTRLVESEVRLFRSRSEYAIALKNIQYEKGTLLSYANMQLVGFDSPSETPSEPQMIDPIPAAAELDIEVTQQEFSPSNTVAGRAEIKKQLAQIQETMKTGRVLDIELAHSETEVENEIETIGFTEASTEENQDENGSWEVEERTIEKRPEEKKSLFSNIKLW